MYGMFMNEYKLVCMCTCVCVCTRVGEYEYLRVRRWTSHHHTSHYHTCVSHNLIRIYILCHVTTLTLYTEVDRIHGELSAS